MLKLNLTVAIIVLTAIAAQGISESATLTQNYDSSFAALRYWKGERINNQAQYVQLWKPWTASDEIEQYAADEHRMFDYSSYGRGVSLYTDMEHEFNRALKEGISLLHTAVENERSIMQAEDALELQATKKLEEAELARVNQQGGEEEAGSEVAKEEVDNTDLWSSEFAHIFGKDAQINTKKTTVSTKSPTSTPKARSAKVFDPIRHAFHTMFPSVPAARLLEKDLWAFDAKDIALTPGRADKLTPVHFITPYFGSFEFHKSDSGSKRGASIDPATFKYTTEPSPFRSPFDHFMMYSNATVVISSYAQLESLIRRLGTVNVVMLHKDTSPEVAKDLILEVAIHRVLSFYDVAVDDRRRPMYTFVLHPGDMPDVRPHQWIVHPKNERVVVVDGVKSMERIMNEDNKYISVWTFQMVKDRTPGQKQMITTTAIVASMPLPSKSASSIPVNFTPLAPMARSHELLPVLDKYSFQVLYFEHSKLEVDSRHHAFLVAKTQRLCRRAIKSSKKSYGSSSSSSASTSGSLKTFKGLHKYVDRCFKGVIFSVVQEDSQSQCVAALRSASRSRLLARKVGDGSPFADAGQRHYLRPREADEGAIVMTRISLETHEDKLFYRNLIQGATGVTSDEALAKFSSTVPAEDGCRVLMIAPAMGILKPLWFDSAAELASQGVPLMQLNGGLFTLLARNNTIKGSGSSSSSSMALTKRESSVTADKETGSSAILLKKLRAVVGDDDTNDDDSSGMQMTVPLYGQDDSAVMPFEEDEDGEECSVTLHVVTTPTCGVCHRLTYVLLPSLAERYPWLPIEVYDRQVLLAVAAGDDFSLMSAASSGTPEDDDDQPAEAVPNSAISYLAKRVTDHKKLPTPAVLVQILKRDGTTGSSDVGAEGQVYVYNNRRWDDAAHLARFVRKSMASAGCFAPSN